MGHNCDRGNVSKIVNQPMVQKRKPTRERERDPPSGLVRKSDLLCNLISGNSKNVQMSSGTQDSVQNSNSLSIDCLFGGIYRIPIGEMSPT